MTDANVQAFRQRWVEAWQQHQTQQHLSPLQSLMVSVMQCHPACVDAIMKPHATERASSPATLGDNPFWVLSLHLALKEQVIADHPKGIRRLHQRLVDHHQDQAHAEASMLEVLAHQLAKGHAAQLNDQVYLKELEALADTTTGTSNLG